MKNKVIRLPDSELEVMLTIWDAGKSLTTGEVIERLGALNKWHMSTVQKLLTRLVERNYLSCEKNGRLNLYASLIDEQAYREQETKTFIEKLHHNSAKSLIATLVSSKTLSEEELKEIADMLNTAGEP
jgi:BlaI family penicillinase repressor